jgi:hypothetical protein
MIAERFTFDSYAENEDSLFNGFHNPRERWNGWACPFFPMSECVRILNYVGQYQDELEVGYRLAGDGLEWAIETDDGSPDWITLKSRTVDGVEVFPLGSWGWVWDEFPRPIMLPDGTCNKCAELARDCGCL